ncbi:transporter substrate-binding domain-containing protein [Krasilnikovia sp. M28-CT-15]|uniref:transporter substrate-binding domain-containing protein n=1 Tax=Krasilnikovia sp. M28-CT-15 TaxID=3373540 RepID=UPI00387617E4
MRLRYVAPSVTAIAVLLAAGCGSTTDSGVAAAPAKNVTVTVEGAGPVTTDPRLASTVPGDVRAKGTVTVATNAPYQPFIDFAAEGRTDAFKGLDLDLLTAASAKLGLATTFSQQPFDGLIPGLQAAKYDAIAGGITDKKERHQVATFVDYSASGTGFLVRTGNPQGIKTVADLCGRKVAAQKASNQAKHLAEYSAQSCAARPIAVQEYPENPQAVQALLAGNADAVAATQVNLTDITAGLSGKAELVQDPGQPNGWRASPNGFGFLKSRKDLAEAYRAALQALVDDGTYAKILAHYQQQPIALTTITVDQAID